MYTLPTIIRIVPITNTIKLIIKITLVLFLNDSLYSICFASTIFFSSLATSKDFLYAIKSSSLSIIIPYPTIQTSPSPFGIIKTLDTFSTVLFPVLLVAYALNAPVAFGS